MAYGLCLHFFLSREKGQGPEFSVYVGSLSSQIQESIYCINSFEAFQAFEGNDRGPIFKVFLLRAVSGALGCPGKVLAHCGHSECSKRTGILEAAGRVWNSHLLASLQSSQRHPNLPSPNASPCWTSQLNCITF